MNISYQKVEEDDVLDQININMDIVGKMANVEVKKIFGTWTLEYIHIH
jgi:hypothetical protein